MSSFDNSLALAMVASEQCSNCANKAKDVVIGGKVLIAGYTKGICSAYPDGKPLTVWMVNVVNILFMPNI